MPYVQSAQNWYPERHGERRDGNGYESSGSVRRASRQSSGDADVPVGP